ncbi:plasma membrane fusion [Geosmithia morbida]|uniref:Plasma membrane fusion protein PRM1 n=1 Tax=Geosmithia morbida TaxID=1094350 RepID=A0A9P4YZH8_9HYPO|nr:plasma membrane fusion [Geosmithia morbida]KAF4125931.1 plasma membrane fusion [Geosmithia morbida]
MSFPRKDEDPPRYYPEVPDSLRSDPIEMSKTRKLHEARVNTAPYITPYIGLRSRLSQIWINRWTVLLLLVLVRVLLLVVQLNDNVGDAKIQALSACSKVEDVGSSMASMPHYLSVGVNDLAATGIEKSVHAMVTILDLILQGVESLIYFFIDYLVGTYVCLLTALVKGSLDVVADITDDANDAINKVIGSATKEINDISDSLTSKINSVLDGIQNNILPGADTPKVNFSEPVDTLNNFSLDGNDFAKDIRALNNKIPDFDDVRNLTKEAIAIPFDFVRRALNDSYGSYTFDRDVFPLAQREKMTFCSDNDTLTDFFQTLSELIQKARVIFIAVLVILAITVMIPMAWFEIQRWRKQQYHARLIGNNQFDSMDLVYITSRPITSTLGIKLGSSFSGKRQILVRWCVAYATSPPAIFVLSLALAGFFSCACQGILLHAVEKEVPALAKEVGEFADGIVSSLNTSSTKWADSANGVITGVNADINDDVLGYVRNATDAVNDTITTFMDTISDSLETVFNDTLLIDPIKSVVRRVIGLKVESIQEGLTWVHDHAKVSLPPFPDGVFSEGAKESIDGDSDLTTFLASSSSATTDEVSGAVTKVINWLRNNIITEALVSTGILLVYIIVVLMGVIRALVGMVTPDKTRAEGAGNMAFVGNDDAPATPPQTWQRDGQYAGYGNDSQDQTGVYASTNEKPTARPRQTSTLHVW